MFLKMHQKWCNVNAEVGDWSQLLARWATRISTAGSNSRGVTRLVLSLSFSNFIVSSSMSPWWETRYLVDVFWASGMSHQRRARYSLEFLPSPHLWLVGLSPTGQSPTPDPTCIYLLCCLCLIWNGPFWILIVFFLYDRKVGIEVKLLNSRVLL